MPFLAWCSWPFFRSFSARERKCFRSSPCTDFFFSSCAAMASAFFRLSSVAFCSDFLLLSGFPSQTSSVLHLDLLTTFLGGTIDPDRLLDADPKVALSQPCGTTLWKLTSGGIPSRRSLRTSGLCLTMWWNARINPPDNLRSCTNVIKQVKCPDGRIITIVSKLAYFTSLLSVKQPAYIVVVILIHLPFVPAGHPSSS